MTFDVFEQNPFNPRWVSRAQPPKRPTPPCLPLSHPPDELVWQAPEHTLSQTKTVNSHTSTHTTATSTSTSTSTRRDRHCPPSDRDRPPSPRQQRPHPTHQGQGQSSPRSQPHQTRSAKNLSLLCSLGLTLLNFPALLFRPDPPRPRPARASALDLLPPLDLR